MAQSIEIRRVSDNKKFILFEAETQNASWSLSVKRFKFEEPDGDGTNNLSINMGTEKVISFPFKLLKTTEDASGGTNTSTVKTISEKVNYLIGTKSSNGTTFVIEPFLKSGVTDFYFIDITSHTGSWLNNKVQLDNINFSITNVNIESLTGNMSFTIGGGYQ
jgi:hypothetical protein